MVAVTTTRPPYRSTRPAPRRLVVGERAEVETARCGCRHHRSPFTPVGRRLAVVHPVPASTYRRRRLVAAVVVAGLLIAAWAALGALGGALTASGRSAPDLGSRASVAVVEVGPGDTLWTIARRLQPSGDVRPLVDRLAASRGGTVLQVGERIEVPARR